MEKERGTKWRLILCIESAPVDILADQVMVPSVRERAIETCIRFCAFYRIAVAGQVANGPDAPGSGSAPPGSAPKPAGGRIAGRVCPWPPGSWPWYLLAKMPRGVTIGGGYRPTVAYTGVARMRPPGSGR